MVLAFRYKTPHGTLFLLWELIDLQGLMLQADCGHKISLCVHMCVHSYCTSEPCLLNGNKPPATSQLHTPWLTHPQRARVVLCIFLADTQHTPPSSCTRHLAGETRREDASMLTSLFSLPLRWVCLCPLQPWTLLYSLSLAAIPCLCPCVCVCACCLEACGWVRDRTLVCISGFHP